MITAELPKVTLVRVDVGEGIAFWAPLVGLTLEREPEIEKYLKTLVVSRGRSEKTSKDYAGWLVPAIQYRLINELDWTTFAYNIDDFLIWRRSLRRSTKGRGMHGPSRETLKLMMIALNEFYRHAIRHGDVRPDVRAILFDATDESRLPEHLRSHLDSPELRLRSRFEIRAGAAEADRQVRYRRERAQAATPVEFEQLLGQVRTARDAFILALLRFCALRVGQVVTLKRDRVHGLPDVIACGSQALGPHLHIEKALDHPHRDGVKRRDPFAIPMPAPVVQLWWAWLEERAAIRLAAQQPWLLVAFGSPSGREGQAISAEAVRDLISRLCKRAGLRHLTPHQLRHSFGEEAADADMPPDLLQRLLGHASIHSQDPYRRKSDAALAAAVVELDRHRARERAR
jgi:integrase/recombinase XerD